jgi:Fanconi-associated nuclease 1
MHSNNKKRGAESKRLTQSTLFTFFTHKKQKTKNNETKEEVIIEQVVKEEEKVEIVAKPLSIEKEEYSTPIEQKFSDSIYTQEFDDMVQTVLDGEDYLLDEKELDLCCRFVGLKGFFFVKRTRRRFLYIYKNR